VVSEYRYVLDGAFVACGCGSVEVSFEGVTGGADRGDVPAVYIGGVRPVVLVWTRVDAQAVCG
jgi:hypothetical protein